MKRNIMIFDKQVKMMNFIIVTVIIVMVLGILTYLIVVNDDNEILEPNGKSVEASALVANPGDYNNYGVEFIGKVFVVEGGRGKQALQIYSNEEKTDGNIVVYNSSNTVYKEGDYVKIKGTVLKSSEGENAFGTKLTLALVIADTLELVDANTALAPAVNSKDLNISKQVGNLTVTLNRVEYAKDETRLYLRFDNKTADEYRFYSFNSTFIQGRTNIKEKSVYDRGESLLPDSLPAGTVEEVKIYYERADSTKPATYTLEVTNQSSYDSAKLDFTF